ncbi:hypothetical protein ACLOJK_026494 [Asimina triloba]
MVEADAAGGGISWVPVAATMDGDGLYTPVNEDERALLEMGKKISPLLSLLLPVEDGGDGLRL